MAHRLTLWTIVPAVAATTLLAAGCAHKFDNQPPSDWNRTYTAVVGPVIVPPSAPDAPKNLARLKAYHQALQDVTGVTDLLDQYIGCIGCDKLTTSPPDQLKYIFYREHVGNMHAFTRAMRRVQASPLGDLDFTLTYDTKNPPGPDCPSPCGYKAICAQQCDGIPSTPKCNRCTP